MCSRPRNFIIPPPATPPDPSLRSCVASTMCSRPRNVIIPPPATPPDPSLGSCVASTMCSRPKNVIIPPHPTPPDPSLRPCVASTLGPEVFGRGGESTAKSFWIRRKKFLNPTKKVLESNEKSFWIQRKKFLNPTKKVSESNEKSFWIQRKKLLNPTKKVSESNEKSFWIQRREFLNPPKKFLKTKFLNPTKKFLNPTKKFLNPTKKFLNPTKKFLNPTKEFLNPTKKFLNPGKFLNPTLFLYRRVPWWTSIRSSVSIGGPECQCRSQGTKDLPFGSASQRENCKGNRANTLAGENPIQKKLHGIVRWWNLFHVPGIPLLQYTLYFLLRHAMGWNHQVGYRKYHFSEGMDGMWESKAHDPRPSGR